MYKRQVYGCVLIAACQNLSLLLTVIIILEYVTATQIASAQIVNNDQVGFWYVAEIMSG